MLFRSFYLCILILSISPMPAKAWEACMIFCDMGCTGKAMTGYTKSFVKGFADITKNHGELLSNFADLSKETATMGTDLKKSWMTQTSDIQSSIAATSNAIDLKSELKLQNMKSSVAALSARFSTLKKEQLAFIVSHIVDKQGGVNSLSPTISEHIELSSVLRGDIKMELEHLKALDQSVNNFLNGMDEDGKAYKTISDFYNYVNTKDVNSFYSTHKLASGTMASGEQHKMLQELATYLVASEPLPNTVARTDGTLDTTLEYQRLKYIGYSRLLSSVLHSLIYSNALDSDYGGGPAKRIGSIINSRVSDYEWGATIALLNKHGLEKELLSIKLEESVLLYELLKIRKLTTTVLALRNTIAIES